MTKLGGQILDFGLGILDIENRNIPLIHI